MALDKSSYAGDAEVTGNITLEISYSDDSGEQSAEFTIKSLDTSKEIGQSEIRGNNVKLESTTTTTIDYSGSLSFHGDVKTFFADKLFHSDDTPRACSITITHNNGEKSGYNGVKMTSEGYTADEGEATETTYDWIARDEM